MQNCEVQSDEIRAYLSTDQGQETVEWAAALMVEWVSVVPHPPHPVVRKSSNNTESSSCPFLVKEHQDLEKHC